MVELLLHLFVLWFNILVSGHLLRGVLLTPGLENKRGSFPSVDVGNKAPRPTVKVANKVKFLTLLYLFDIFQYGLAIQVFHIFEYYHYFGDHQCNYNNDVIVSVSR
jgi:hypothetical protein